MFFCKAHSSQWFDRLLRMNMIEDADNNLHFRFFEEHVVYDMIFLKHYFLKQA